MRHFGRNENQSDYFFGLKGDLERVLETLDDAETKDPAVFEKLQGFKKSVSDIRAEVKSMTIDALKSED